MRTQTGHHKDARTDDSADTQRRQRYRSQRSLEVFCPFLFGFRDNQVQRFFF